MTRSFQRLGRDPWILKFSDLMPYIIREILIVSSKYDAFILEEDGPLAERLVAEYSDFNLSFIPRITHADSASEAINLIKKRKFDLVLTIPRLEGIDVGSFAKMVRQISPQMPLVLLAFDERYHLSKKIDSSVIDRTFLWSGDARILFAIIKLIEDARNVEHDTKVGNIQVIIVVEDSVRHYSSFLALLYSEIMKQSHAAIADALSDLHKLVRMRARPKILHATNYEQAWEYYEKYKNNVLALMTDARFPINGAIQPKAGFELIRKIRGDERRFPILMQSADTGNEAEARAMNIKYISKNAPHLLQAEVLRFLSTDLGFGDFIFRMPDETEIGRARNLYEMEMALHSLPLASLKYHASNNDFSMWLKARSVFILASLIRPWKESDFTDLDEMRHFLIEVFHTSRIQEQSGVIADFAIGPQLPSSEKIFMRVGAGSIGGKGRGLAFVNALLCRQNVLDEIEGIQFQTPRTVVVGTDEFDRFIQSNFSSNFHQEFHSIDEKTLKQKFLEGHLSSKLIHDLKIACMDLVGPLAIRSSGLLEDSEFLPFAGIYSTYMLPNNHFDPEVRLEEIFQAIKAVYYSTFSRNAQNFIASTPYSIDEEKMAVIIQEVVGRRYNDRFYPDISGVAMSYNYYPVGGQRADEGIAMVALGLGKIVVQGGKAMRFCPSSPETTPQFSTSADVVRNSQSSFYAIDLSCTRLDFAKEADDLLVKYQLSDAENDGTLASIGSIYSIEDDKIRDNLELPGPRVVTFNNILKWNSVPLASALKKLLQAMQQAMGCAVEIEFAVDLHNKSAPTLYILQIRPFVHREFVNENVEPGNFPHEKLLCQTKQSLGHGIFTDVSDIVYVKFQAFAQTETPLIARQIGEITSSLRNEKRKFFLIGPGRWGTSDPRLGVPVDWTQISGACVIAETPMPGFPLEPSQGTHFFQNITSLGIGYLTLPDGALDVEWLEKQIPQREIGAVRHIRLENPLSIYLNGPIGEATVLKPKD